MRNIFIIYSLILLSNITIAQKFTNYTSPKCEYSIERENINTNNISVYWGETLKKSDDNSYFFSVDSKIGFSCFGVGVQSNNTNLKCIDYTIEHRIFVDDKWTKWQKSEFEYSAENNNPKLFWSELLFTPNQKLRTKVEFKIQTSDGSDITKVRFDAYDVISDKPIYKTETASINKSTSSCPELPSVIGRDIWLWPYYGQQSYTPTIITPDHIVIHHGASPDTYTDGAVVVRSYWDYHVNSNGWSDIGYNFLTDKYGNLYQGRKNSDIVGQDVRGAHAGAANDDAIGLNFLGNADVTVPTTVQLDLCSKFMAWWFSTRGGSPTGSGLMTTQSSGILDIPMISGHRDVNIGGTTCPGDVLYLDIPDLRTSTQAILDNCNSTVTTEVNTVNQWKTQGFTADFTDISTGSAIKEKYYQIIDFNGNYWHANEDYGFLKDNFYELTPSWENFAGNWSILYNNLNQNDETSSNTILSSRLNQNNNNSFLYSFTAKIGGTGTNRRAGLHFMCDTNDLANRGNSYLVYFRLDNNEVEIYRTENDVLQSVNITSYTFNENTYYDFSISFNKTSGEIIVFVNEQKVSSWIDTTPHTNGNYISFRTGNCTMDIAMIQVYHSRTNSEFISVGDSTKEVRYQNPNPTTFSAKIKSVAIDSLDIMSAVNYHNLFIDWTVPNNFDVNDGTSTDIDNFSDSTSLSANWTDAVDENSDILTYYYCIATSIGDSDIVNWTNNSLNTQFTETGLSLTLGETYYVGVRAMNNAGLITTDFYSNGQTLIATDVAELNKNNAFKIYPNPTENYLYITINNNRLSKEIYIVDLMGKTVKTINSDKLTNLKIDISDFNSGVYFIKIGNYSSKFIKM